ncbi:tetratricopeptide repeat protein [Roseovarius sp. THAF9]|uniref:tetratricopeptide repeat protein n=1 Tax=Roseovarius sp. THAF9 TaxID=2587847 RepID=UPI001269548F|nr:tetratricopeptide repeat protein [Roseovarius sp. THAF9]QFT93976.1 tetratricopeptide repeat protein [Roseovarius sp. THAF9]
MTQSKTPGALMADLRALDAGGQETAVSDLLASILRHHPDFMPAHRFRIDRLLGAGLNAEALDLAQRTANAFPAMRAMTTTRQATALDRLGQTEQALRMLGSLHDDAAEDMPATVLFATLLARDGMADRAEPLFRQVLSQAPDHPGARRGLIDIALARGDADAALDLCDDARPHDDAAASLLSIRRARALDHLGRTSEAAALLDSEVAGGNRSDQVLIQLAWMQRQLGRLDAALQSFAAVLATTPDHLGAVQGSVAILRQQGAMDAALKVCDAAIAKAKDAPDLIHMRRAEILTDMGRASEAAAALKTARASGDATGQLDLALARAYVALGNPDAAREAFEQAARSVETRATALMGLADLSRKAGDHDRTLTHLNAAAETSDGADAAVTLALCEALIHAGRARQVAPHLRALIESDAPLNDPQIEQLLNIAERQALPDVTRHLIRLTSGRSSLTAALARRLLRLAHITADRDSLDRITHGLLPRVPPQQRCALRAEAVALCDGPDAAIEFARTSQDDRGTPDRIIVLGRLLIDAGTPALAMRYLRFALRTWPAHPALVTVFVHACVGARDFTAGHACLDRLENDLPGTDTEAHRLALFYGAGADRSVLDRALRRRDLGLPGLHPRQLLDLCLSCGDLDRALAIQNGIRNDPGSSGRVAAHFTTGLQGRMLTDLHVFRTLEAKAISAGVPPEDASTRLADQYYYPAKCILDAWADQSGSTLPRRETPVPHRIFQYWDRATPPDDIAGLIAGWQNVPGFEHVLMNRTRAITMLRRQFGPRVVTAFQRARHVTEESDLLRLCLIFRFGGVYSDADDRRVGDIADLADLGAGLLVSREPIGAIANNTLIAPPGNPILRIALQMTVQALLARDSDGAWFKSGPGMLTRAAAVFLRDAETSEAVRNLTLIDGETLRRHVEPHIRLPYKKTASYWNAQDRALSKTVRESLLGLADLPERDGRKPATIG